jgi:anti-anti-sigma factor
MSSHEANLTTECDSGTLRLRPRADLVASTVEAQRAGMLAALEAKPGSVVLDLAAVEQLDSLGLTLILGLFKTCQGEGVAFSLAGVRPDLMRVFRLFNLPKYFPIAEA